MMTHHLPIGHPIKDLEQTVEYTILEVLGRGASTIAYLTIYSDESGCSYKCILKEYYPSFIELSRDADGSILYDKQFADQYQAGFERFKAGALRQNQLRNQSNLTNETSPLQRIFFANNTCYLVVTLFEGHTFDKIDAPLLERLKICLTTAKVIQQCHANNLLYLDLKPQNIFVKINCSNEIVTEEIVLIDFDSITPKDQIAFGRSLSFTKSWAAPEQTNPYSFRKISEATDIYAIGELVFWSVFGRHSAEEEHRGFSTYPFECVQPDGLRRPIQYHLSQLFKRTLRSSPRNRFTSMSSVIELIEKVVEELSKGEFILPYDITPKKFFVGRDAELAAISKVLMENKVVFITGIAGIGKSELVKQYAHRAQNQYDQILYWTYDGSLVSMVCNDSVNIENFRRDNEDDDERYCARKINKLRGLLTANSLILIDNVDVLSGEFAHPDVWKALLSMPGKIIVSSKCNETEYENIRIDELQDVLMLRCIFNEYCPAYSADDSQIEYVDRIISIANRHTYEIALLAAYTEVKMQTPQKTLYELENEGFSALGTTNLTVQKDGVSPSGTFSAHIEKLLSMSSLSESQKLLLLKLSFMPAIGVSANEFKEFYGISDVNDLDWLKRHGFVFHAENSSHTLTVHQSVSQTIISLAKTSADLISVFFNDAIIAMRRGYDDQSVNRNFVDKYPKTSVTKDIYYLLCRTIAEKAETHKIDCESAAQYITLYIEWFAKYGIDRVQHHLLKYVTNLYDSFNPEIYLHDREYAYLLFADFAMRLSVSYPVMIDFCTEHFERARKAKDWPMASCWCANLYRLKFSQRDVDTKSARRMMVYEIRSNLEHNRLKKKHKNSFFFNLTDPNIRSVEFNESMYDLTPHVNPWAKIVIRNLYWAIFTRRKVIDPNCRDMPSENSIRIAIDQAQIYVLQAKYYSATKILSDVLEPYSTGQYLYTSAVKDAYNFTSK